MTLELPSQTLVESADSELELSSSQVEALADLGRRMASRKEWWGQDDDDYRDRSVIQVSPAGSGRWRVRVVDAVGVVVIDGLQLIVEPKIPISHLLYLLAMSGEDARHQPLASGLAVDESLWEVVAGWFTGSVERLLHADLARDYDEISDLLSTPIGRMDPVATTARYLAGDLSFAATFDEFSPNSPLNRILRAALQDVVRSPRLRTETRRRAVRALSRMEEVSDLRPGDLVARVNRQTRHYAVPISLARHILGGQGRGLSVGTEASWAFLIRTPEMVERGIRELLNAHLPLRVRKGRLGLPGSSLTVNPDLVFGNDVVVGDVKYKVGQDTWVRPDLYQVVAFATAYRAPKAIVVRFIGPGATTAPAIEFGDVSVAEFSWVADPEITPERAAGKLVAAVSSIPELKVA
jgi:5-methylcytosine-specific restriction endonuclease McrBC regulatory subunit McrC